MEKKRGNQVMAIAALFIAVIGLSLGFAAFSNTLTISSSASVTPDASVFNVDLSTVATGDTATAGNVLGVLAPEPTAGTYNEEHFTAGTATIANDPITAGSTSNAEITGLRANFTEPGQSVTYTFYAKNVGQLNAFLNSVEFQNVSGESSTKVCTPGTGATAGLVSAACNAISINVSVGGSSFSETNSNVSSHQLAIAGNETVIVTITYAAETSENVGAYRADGPFEVAFGNIVLTYGSVD